jgi:hypothetical protein
VIEGGQSHAKQADAFAERLHLIKQGVAYRLYLVDTSPEALQAFGFSLIFDLALPRAAARGDAGPGSTRPLAGFGLAEPERHRANEPW